MDQFCGYSEYYYYHINSDPCLITTTNIFTPNDDSGGLNNTFEFNGLVVFRDGKWVVLYPGSVLKVYNRWGSLVYENENYDNSWKAEGLSEGTYYYVFMQNFENQADKFFHGDVYITR